MPPKPLCPMRTQQKTTLKEETCVLSQVSIQENTLAGELALSLGQHMNLVQWKVSWALHWLFYSLSKLLKVSCFKRCVTGNPQFEVP